MGAAVRLPLGAAVTSPGQARHETDEQLDALRVERGGKCTMQCIVWRRGAHPTTSGPVDRVASAISLESNN